MIYIKRFYRMINLKNEIVAYQKEGLSAPLARARVCQDVVLLAISKGALKRNKEIKSKYQVLIN